MSVRGVIISAFTALTLVVATAPAAQGAGWGDRFDVSQPAADDAGTYQPQVLADDDGDFTYLWIQNRGSDGTALLSRVAHSDGSLGPIRTVTAADANGNPSEFSASIGPDGEIRVAWLRSNAFCSPVCVFSYRLEYTQLGPDATPAFAPVLVDTNSPPGALSHVSLATNPDGKTAIVWANGQTGDTDVLAAIAPAGAEPLAPFSLAEHWTGISGTTTSAAANGTIGAAFYGWNTDSGDNQIDARLLLGDGSVTDLRQANANTDNAIEEGEIVTDATGRSTIVWQQYNGSQTEILYRQMSPAGELLLGSPSLASNASSDEARGTSHRAGVAGDGTVYIAFDQIPGSGLYTGIWIRTISPTGSLGSARMVAGGTADLDARYPLLSVSPKGGGLVTYVTSDQSDPSTNPIAETAVSFDAAGARVGQPTTLESFDQHLIDDNIYPAALAFSGTGDAAAAWSREVGASDYEDEVHSAIYDGVAPEATLWAPAKATVGQEIVVGVEASDRSPVTFGWKVDGHPITAGGPFIRHTFESAGTATIEATVTDSAGNATTVRSDVDVVAAGVTPPPNPVPPDTLIKAKPAKKTKSRRATFKFVASLTGSKFECRLDKAGWTDCKSPLKLKKLKPGKHTFKVRATKGDMIDQSPASRTWTVEKKKKKKHKK